jgi:hypothetical protein
MTLYNTINMSSRHQQQTLASWVLLPNHPEEVTGQALTKFAIQEFEPPCKVTKSFDVKLCKVLNITTFWIFITGTNLMI